MKTVTHATKFVFILAVIGILAFAVGCSNETAPPIAVTGITVTGAADADTVANGETLQMSALVLPSDATDAGITWSVADGTGSATISTGGLLSATSAGTVTVTATANTDTAIKGNLTVTVTASNVVINIASIPGVTVPVRSVLPDLTVTETDQYTATITWEPENSPFASATVYTATITVTAKDGYTLTGVVADSFTVAGATSTHAAGSGVVTAIFPATAAAPDTAVSITSILGVSAPVTGETPDFTVTETDQYTGTVVWAPVASPFAPTTVYIATVTLTAKSGYTFTGVAANSFTVPDATTSNLVDSGILTAEFPITGAAPPTAVTLTAIAGVTAPVRNVTPVSTVTETAQYTGTVAWEPADSPFDSSTAYTATITLTAKSGFTFTGVAANSFTVAESTATNLIDSGVVTAVFNETEAAPDVAVNLIAISGVTAPVKNVTPDLTIAENDQYTAVVTWSPDESPYAADRVYTATITLTAKSGYTLAGVAADSFTVADATTTNPINSGVVTAIFPATAANVVSLKAISGVVVPVRAATPDLTIAENEQYTGTVEWDPVHIAFAPETVYTATITLTEKPGFTFTGVAANSFTVLGATTVTNLVDSGIITAVFPETSVAPLAAVNLRTAENYVILAETLISTTGTTAIVGDIGISPYATTFITGFALVDATGWATSSLVTGKVYAADMADPTPIELTTAVADMLTAYTDAAGRPTPTETELGSGAIGGMTLASGLYKWGGSVGIGADLTLDGGADDVWIFQIAEDLTIASSFSVKLAGGARKENIFWQVGGIATLGTGAHMEGVIMSQTQIILQNGSSVNGRLLAQTQVTLDAVSINVPPIE